MKEPIRKGIIIAGGMGTRLRPLTNVRPKPLVPVANRPFLEYQVALLRQHGIEDIVFATNYLAERIEAHFGDGSAFGVTMQYAREETPLGTGGAIRNAASLFPDESVAVFNGDILTDFDLGEILRFHAEKSATATITLAPVTRPHPFGVVSVSADGRVSGWHEPSQAEKQAAVEGGPRRGDTSQDIAPPDLINAGFYVLSPYSLQRIPDGVPSSIEREIFPALIAEGGVYGIAPEGFWMDVGRPSQLLAATQALLGGNVSTPLPVERISEGATIAASAHVDALSSIGKGCSVDEGATIERSILLDGARVGRGARLRGVILDEGARTGEDETLESRGEVVIITGKA